MVVLRILYQRAIRYVGLLAALFVVIGLAFVTAASVRSAPDVDNSTGPHPAAVLLPETAPVAGLSPLPPRRGPEAAKPADPGESCEEAFRGWTTEDGHVVAVRVRRCLSFEWAAYQQALILDDARRLHATQAPVEGIPLGVQIMIRQPSGAFTQPATQVVARRGNYVLQATVLSDPERLDDDAAIARAVAALQWSRLTGTPGAGVHIPVRESMLSGVGWVLGFLVIALYVGSTLIGSVRNSVRGTRALSGEPNSTYRLRWIDVTTQATGLAVVARGRFWIIVSLMAGSQALPLPLPARVAMLGAAPLFYHLGGRHTPGARLLWGKHAESQIRTKRNQSTAVLCLVLSGATLIVGLGALMTPAILLQLSGTEVVGADGRWHPTVVADDPSFWRSVPVRLLALDLFLVSVGLLLTSGLLYRLARRSSALDVKLKIAADRRAPIIFLRNFSDDETTIRTSPLTRKAVVDKLGLGQFERFEEILVRYLSAYGPVIAINNPNSKKVPLGAARETLPHGVWQNVVGSRIDACAMIVVAVAPGADTEGLKWELNEIMERAALRRTILVLPPYPAAQLPVRWRRFLTMAGRMGVPEATAAHADRILALTSSGYGNWDAYHARRRTDWAYAVALAAAAEAKLPHVAPAASQGATGRQVS